MATEYTRCGFECSIQEPIEAFSGGASTATQSGDTGSPAAPSILCIYIFLRPVLD